ncbi:MAG: LutC/YkgG family protein [Galactobacter sp.]
MNGTENPTATPSGTKTDAARAKADILARIRSALVDAPAEVEVPREYRRGSDMSQDELVELLVDRLVHYKAGVDVVPAEQVPGAVKQLLSSATSFVTPPGLADEVLGELVSDPRRVIDSPENVLGVMELDATSAVVTSSAVSVAESGTIILDGSPDQGRRAITLVPDHHVCVVPASSIERLLPAALERLDTTRPLTWISGPSATSDIELERVEGVHGPRTLDVLIVKDR